MAPMVAVTLDEDPPEPVSHGPGAEDLQVVVGRHPFGDPGDEPLQVLQAARLAGVLRAAAAAVTDARIVAHVARAPTMGRHVGQGMLDHDPVIAPADDDRLTGVDPDQRARSRRRLLDRRLFAGPRDHDCAHAGPESARAARSA